MGNYMMNSTAALLILSGSLLAFSSVGIAQEKEEGFKPTSLGDAFGQPQTVTKPAGLTDAPEVEPVVVGRKKWSDRPASESSVTPPPQSVASSDRIEELAPLETEQQKGGKIEMPLIPPVTPPAVNIHRNFEGTLVLKPRKLGFEKSFPFQLENSRGKRLAFVDMKNLRIIDPLDFKDSKVNVLGKLEAVEKGSDELVIRARLVRKID